MSRILSLIFCAIVIVFAVSASQGQQMQFYYTYSFEPAMITEPPELLGRLEVEFPEEARKQGVEGTVKVSCVLGEDGKIRDIKVLNDLGHGTGAAVSTAVQRLTFKPAKFQDKPAPMTMSVDYKISLYYNEDDKAVTKPKIVEKPLPMYPASERANGMKGKVSVTVLFRSNGEVEVLRVNSVMEKAFDNAAVEAAKRIKFNPAAHKKSKKPVSQAMTVEYDFKP